MRTTVRESGLVAILDALGAASYGDSEIQRFLRSRQTVLELLDDHKDDLSYLKASDLTTFTFNDTIVIVLRCGKNPPNLKLAAAFSGVLRKFLVDSMDHGLLFRGSASIGTFYVDEETNTVMGDAVTDAAQWYGESDWIGVHFTPRSCITLDRMIEGVDDQKGWAFVRYPVPMKAGPAVRAFSINWPKVFLAPTLRPWNEVVEPRAKLLELLGNHRIPKGTEQKYENTVAFFDFSANIEKKRSVRVRTSS